ncbi:Polysaccharide deacetylase [Prosthecobacter debontii]|uniref:Polysaccharide deacetylase n=1 Tax=Prosthecobacter debontii TaxID=48467 RepID=A0A1T4WFK7_9BACT|nr:polysaccharide deacetylase family protein [Prosthecobacter debontii]SKA75685.1 Polysaccharide deacetylase [Prosthecobacter debontii]
MALPALEQPAECRRENARRFVVSLLPGTAVVLLLTFGQWGWAAIVFWTVFAIIGYGSTIPSSRLFGPHVTELPEPQTQQNQVWITLDDGPDPVITPLLLDILDRHQAKAGFFLIGDRAQKHPDLVREIAKRGHLIGNHSQTHPSANFWILRPKRMWAEVAGCQKTLGEILGTPPTWFRPPVGHHNLFLSPPLRALGLTMAIWNCRGFDGVIQDPALILELIGKQLRPGSIILLHDAVPSGPDVLESTLKLIQARGLHPALPEIASPDTRA